VEVTHADVVSGEGTEKKKEKPPDNNTLWN
jgi:hypothetical protein